MIGSNLLDKLHQAREYRNLLSGKAIDQRELQQQICSLLQISLVLYINTF